MKKLLYISFVLAFFIAFVSCEKREIKPVKNDDRSEYYSCDHNSDDNMRGQDPDPTGNGGGGIVDPDEDDDDLDDDGEGTIVDPDEDDDDLDDDDGK